MNRSPGLYTRKGQLRFAQEGENVVVTIGERTVEPGEKSAKRLRIEHEDMKSGGLVTLK